MTITFFTLGCKVNQYETEVMRELFSLQGYTNAKNTESADVIVINSCTVTAESDRKTRQLVRRCRRKNERAVIVLTGCMVQAFAENAALLQEADIIVGNTDIDTIPLLVKRFKEENKQIISVRKHFANEPYNTPSVCNFSERTRAYMKIEDGCERYCTYCIIPTARGPVRSRSLEDIRKEAEILAEKGFSEIVLVGINLSAYGKGENYNLCDAVETVCKVEGIQRVRLGSLEPDHITDDMLMRFKAQQKFCPQFHLSLQSGCDATLKRMNRHYDSAFYYDLITRIRRLFENASITTDIMVGFAGETEQEFNESLNFAKKCAFAKAHVFMYSRRTGTVAAALKNQVENSVKEERSHQMINVTEQSEKEFLENQCGKIFPVLFETSANGYIEGYTPNYSRVLINGDTSLLGSIINVKILSCQGDYCIGEPV